LKTPNTIEDEIHAIRTAIYEEVKGMSPSEMNEYFRKQVAPINKEFGLHPIDKLPDSTKRAAL